jgi:hypothetical protein
MAKGFTSDGFAITDLKYEMMPHRRKKGISRGFSFMLYGETAKCDFVE